MDSFWWCGLSYALLVARIPKIILVHVLEDQCRLQSQTSLLSVLNKGFISCIALRVGVERTWAYVGKYS